MATLATNKTHTWKKNEYSRLDFDWAVSSNPGTGKVSVKQGDRAASHDVPGTVTLNGEAGSLTNNTDKTIQYTLT